MMRMTLVLAAAAALAMAPAGAQEEVPDLWSGKASLGFASVSGNAEGSTLAADFTLGYDPGRWHHEVNGAAFRATSTDQSTNESATTAERYKLGYKAQYDINEFDYLFGRLNFERDLFGGYDQQISETVGYGRRVLHSGAHTLNLEAGAGAKQSDLSDGSSDSEFIVRLGGDYVWKFSENGKFTQRLGVEIGSNNTYTEAVSELAARLVGNLGLALGLTFKNNSDVPTGTEKTDTYTSVTLQYSF